jgi:hypothetical protein
MTEQQTPKLASALVEHQGCFNGLTTEEAQWVIMETTAAIAVCVGAIKIAYAKAHRILEFISTIVVPATTTKFVAKNKFVVNTDDNAQVKIFCVWDNFTTWFLSGKGKTEGPITEQTLRYHKLRTSSVDGPIITELGGKAKAETTLSEMFSLMERQKGGEAGVLLTNGYANIFYAKDTSGTLRAVGVGWYGDGWYVYARSVEYPRDWSDGFRVFSRNS